MKLAKDLGLAKDSKVKVYCRQCGEKLTAVIGINKDIKASPCAYCLKHSYNEGHHKGVTKGLILINTSVKDEDI